MAKKITWEDKEHILPYGTRENQVWDLDMNEIKTVVNANADSLAGLEGGYQGVLLIADTPTNDGYYLAGESGTYTNAGGLVVDLTDTITFINKVGVVYTKTEIPLTVPTLNAGTLNPASTITAPSEKTVADYTATLRGGTVASGETKDVSGGEVYKADEKIQSDVNVIANNTHKSFTLDWDVGFFYNSLGAKVANVAYSVAKIDISNVSKIKTNSYSSNSTAFCLITNEVGDVIQTFQNLLGEFKEISLSDESYYLLISNRTYTQANNLVYVNGESELILKVAEIESSVSQLKVAPEILVGSWLTQNGQAVTKSYVNSNLTINSSGYGGGIPCLDGSDITEFQFTIGTSITASNVFPVFARLDNSMSSSGLCTDYICFRLVGTEIQIKKIKILNSNSTEVLNINLLTIPYTGTFSQGDVVKITYDENGANLYKNDVLIVTYDLYKNNPEFNQFVGAVLYNFTGSEISVMLDVSTVKEFIVQSKISAYKLNLNIDRLGNTDKIANFTFDDVIYCFQDLTNQNGVYTSIFQNSFLGNLKRIHDNYGAVFSLFCFYQNSDATFNLTNVPNSYASEFADNSDWLKFGFHALDEYTNYASTTSSVANLHYTNFIAEIYRITGTYNSIAKTVRLANYAGNSESIIAMRDNVVGINGLLTSNDVRNNYDLTSTENVYIYGHNRIVNSENHINYYRTLDASVFLTPTLLESQTYFNKKEIVSGFLHEYEISNGYYTSMENLFAYLLKNGYNFKYL